MKPILLFLLFFLGPSTLFAQDRHIARLAQELQSSDVAIRRQAAIALGRASYPQSVDLLRRSFPNEVETSIRLEIVRALANIVFLRFPGYPEALRALGDAADGAVEKNELVRLRATEALWEAAKKDLLDPVPFLERNLGDRSQRLRLSAVQMLRKLGNPATVPPLGRAALDKTQTETIRLKAIEALGAISLSDPGPAGREVARANIRTTGLLGVPQLADPGLLERRHQLQINFLAQVARDSGNSPSLILRAVKSMGQVKHKSSIPVLNELITTHPNPAVRKQATRVLSHVLARQYE
ncbi:MAG: HEAT repeat domain-containing protein [Gemmatimonadetes bacterium]|nr:HEAT repeat domain-containing protein [Gemmatimonadota bacterium]